MTGFLFIYLPPNANADNFGAYLLISAIAATERSNVPLTLNNILSAEVLSLKTSAVSRFIGYVCIRYSGKENPAHLPRTGAAYSDSLQNTVMATGINTP